MRPLEQRDYQLRIISKTHHAFCVDGIKSVLIESPTGSGKTVMGLSALKRIKETYPEIRFGWVAMRQKLLTQAAEENERVGVQDIKFVSMFDSKPPKCDLLVTDEAQHDAAATMATLHKEMGAKWSLGLTATPFRTDRVKLSYEKIIRDCGVRFLIEEGWLSPFDQCVIPNWTPLEIAKQLISNPKRWGKSVVFFHEQKDCWKLHAYLKQYKINSAVMLGSMHIEKEREPIFDAFDEGKLQVLINVQLLTEGFDCLDDKTEILTEKGWKGIGDLGEIKKSYALDPISGDMKLVPILGKAKRCIKHKEKMVEFKSQHLDIRVTEGHRIYYKYRDPNKDGRLSTNTLVKEALQLVGRKSTYALPLSAEYSFPGIDLTDDEIKLLAWFLTDGWLEGRYKSDLYIGQTKKRWIPEIRSLFRRLGLDFTEKTKKPTKGAFPNGKPHTQFRCPKGTSKAKPRYGWKRLSRFIFADKRIVSELHKMDKRQFKVFWAEALKGDGNKTERRSGWLWCEQKHHADEYTKMAVLRGFATACAPFQTKKGKIIWRVTARDKRWIGTTPSDPRATRIRSTDPLPNEQVWCVRNRLGTLVTRRNGKVVILGNCPDLQTVWVRDSGKLCTMQMAGRVLRKDPNNPGKVAQIVQSEETRWPYPRCVNVKPHKQFIWQDGHWRSLEPSDKVERVMQKTAELRRSKVVVLPGYLSGAEERVVSIRVKKDGEIKKQTVKGASDARFLSYDSLKDD